MALLRLSNLIDFPLQRHVIFITALLASSLSGSSFALRERQTCMVNSNCGSGLHCETCLANGNVRPRCTRIQPLNPISKVKGLPFNRYSWLTTHNSFAQLGAKSATGSLILAPENQQDSISSQLRNGVRALMIDLYDFENGIWLCHSFGGNCYNYTAFLLPFECIPALERQYMIRLPRPVGSSRLCTWLPKAKRGSKSPQYKDLMKVIADIKEIKSIIEPDEEDRCLVEHIHDDEVSRDCVTEQWMRAINRKQKILWEDIYQEDIRHRNIFMEKEL